MNGFCKYCGAPTSDALPVCAQCTALSQTPKSVSTDTTKPNTAAAKAKKSFTIPILSLIAGVLAAAVLFVYLANPLAWGKPGGTDVMGGLKGGVTEKAVATLESPTVSLNGLTIAVGKDNLSDGDREITVTAYDENVDEQTGYACNTYDIDVGGKEHELLYPVEISLPSAESGSCLTHYEKGYDLWVPLQSEINGNTITASLTSFSPVRLEKRGIEQIVEGTCYYIDGMENLNALMRICANYRSFLKITPDQAYAIVENFNTNGNISKTFSVGSGGADDFAWKVAGSTTTAKTNTLYTVGGAIADLGNTFLGGSEVVSKKLAAIGLLVAVAQLWEDVCNEGLQSESTAANLMKNLCTNFGSIATLLNVGSTALSIGMLAVIGSGLVLDAAGTAANNIKKNTMADIYNNYLSDPTLGGFTPGLSWDNKWFNVFEDAYYTGWQNEKSAQARVDAAKQALESKINAEAERVCSELLTEGSDSLSIAVGEAGKYNYYPPVGKNKDTLKKELETELKAKVKNMIYERLNENVTTWIRSFLKNQIFTDIYANLAAAVEPFNEHQRILIQEIPSGAAEMQYSEYTLRLVAQKGDKATLLDSPYHELWVCTAPQTDDEWAQELEFTYLAYCLAGSPNAVALFSPEANSDDIRKAKRTVSFTHNSKSTIVDLSQGDNEFAGVYESSISFDYNMDAISGIDGLQMGTPKCTLKFVINEDNAVSIYYDTSASYDYSLYGASISVSSVSHGELENQPMTFDDRGEWGPEYTLDISLPVQARTESNYGGQAYGGNSSRYDDTGEYTVQVTARVLNIDNGGMNVAAIRGVLTTESAGQQYKSDEFEIHKNK